MSKIRPARCPICGVDTNYTYFIDDGDKKPISWYRCHCGVIFQSNEHPRSHLFSDDVTEDMRGNFEHKCKTYAPIIEELTYGRKLIEVGHGGALYNMEAFSKRGWLTWGIDKDERITKERNLYCGNFSSHNFSPKINGLEEHVGEEIADMNFDLVWATNCLEENIDPIGFIKKAYDVLTETGVLFISTPDISFINKTGLSGFPHFDKKRSKILWSEEALKRELKKLGFKIIMCRRNYAKRFGGFYDIHLLAQKNYF